MSDQILTCTDLKQMGIIENEEESGGVACCPNCKQGTHGNGEDNFPHVVITPKKKRVDFCCMCYDYVPVSALVGQEASNAWIDKALEALKAAEDHLINVYTTFTRDTIEDWALDREDMVKLRFNDNPGREDGYLIAGVKDSRIISHATDPDGEEWSIEVVPDVGIDLDPEVYRVYQGTNGEWIVEND